jgi:hypothetical protein
MQCEEPTLLKDDIWMLLRSGANEECKKTGCILMGS